VAVPDQLFASLGRLVKRGDGTHRLTIKLQPEALGEVRVVLTVRDGDVSVKLSGSDAAQRALLQGASDLQRLLETVGARNAQVVVGDPTAGQGGQPGLFGQSGQAGQPGTGWAQQQGGRGTQAPSYARPESGAPDPTPTRARSGRSVLDVTV
jgi:flagellar hook-length control protein FliK